MVNCKAGGSCHGGNHAGVYKFARDHGIPDQTCMQYEGHDTKDVCSDFNVCRDCKGPAPKTHETGFDKCWAVTDYTNYYASEYGAVSGAENIKKEVMERGPISCGIYATPDF